jgi:Bacterial DNA polymerase III alpha NTPase domain
MLSSQVWEWSEEGVQAKHVEELNLNLSDRRLKLAIMLAQELIGTPRHLSQHPGGFVLTHDRLDELVPIEPAAMINRQVIEWDKDDIDVEKGALTSWAKPLRVFAFGFAAHEPQNGRLETTVYERGADVLHAIRRQ